MSTYNGGPSRMEKHHPDNTGIEGASAYLVSRVQKLIKAPKKLLIAILFLLMAIGSINDPAFLGAKSTGVSILSAVLTEYLVKKLTNQKWRFPDGAIVTGMIIALVLSAATPFYITIITSVVAILSKFLLKYNKKAIFNPAAFGLLTTAVIFSNGQSWWGGLSLFPAWCMLFVAVGGYWITNKVNKFPQVFTFLCTIFLILLGLVLLRNPSAAYLYQIPYINSILFLAFFMVTDPPTSPAKYKDQIWFGIIAAIVSLVHFLLFGGVTFLLTGLLAANGWKAWKLNKKRRLAS
ncbi:RnfABCDGE type electron transport complex subunit D [Bacillus sp. 03113]|uniref:RnfABCDGE type electron transport complex subunit D n=1 Tax=Bacillus sp. 03113 TaxID=2578211 RepID=UPI00215B9CC7|nr:RnfABCDGE type electron transport complex subunit D [Bacillus sp. 03113]